jgi:hypothetical protein
LHFVWFKGYVGIEGNELTEQLAKKLLWGPVVYDNITREILVIRLRILLYIFIEETRNASN